MTNWKIQYSEKANKDIRDIYEYIAFSLLEIETATKLVSNIIKTVNSLNDMPRRFPVFKNISNTEIRSANIGNFIIFYFVEDKTQTVTIISVIYGGCDIDNILQDIPKN